MSLDPHIDDKDAEHEESVVNGVSLQVHGLISAAYTWCLYHSHAWRASLTEGRKKFPPYADVAV